MNTRNILALAGQYITGLSEVKDNIFRGTLNLADKVAGVYYFDLNNQLLDDFEAYQESLLANEFYSNPGNLQWNYYLFMLNDQLEESAKQQIEKNDKYARKYVVNESEFEDFFTLEKSDASIRPNIVADWKRRLDLVGLEDVYSTRTYVDVIADFKANDVKGKQEGTKSRPKTDADKILFINRLVLGKGYRRYPKVRKYQFARVNLFRGINGVGKTSLFEAIEAMICGKCLRNPSVSMPKGCIEAEFNNSGSLTAFNSANTQLFQARDLNWYSTNSRTNTLYASFNRFNFFNADAAHSFSIASNEREAREALFGIVLGPEYHYISERCQGVLERLRPEFKKLREQVEEEKLKVQRSEKIIKNYKEPKTLGQLRLGILQLYNGLTFRLPAAEGDLALIEERNNELRAVLTTLLSSTNTHMTLADFNASLENRAAKRLTLEAREKELRTLTENHNRLTADEKRLNTLYDFLDRCFLYVQDEKLMKLAGLQAREGEANLTRSKILFCKELIAGIDEKKLALSLDPRTLEADVQRLTKEIKEVDIKINDFLKSLSQIDGILRQIKAHGKEFLELDHNSVTCPLCQSQFDRTELVNRILQERETGRRGQPNDELHLFQTKLENLKSTLVEKQKSQMEQGNIARAYSAAFPEEGVEADYNKAFTRVSNFVALEKNNENELSEISEIKNYANQLGRSEKEYYELSLGCEHQLNESVQFTFGQADSFKKLLEQTMREIAQCKKELGDTLIERTNVGNEIKQLLGVEGTSMVMRDIRQIWDRDEAAFSRIKSSYEVLQVLIELNPNRNLTDLSDQSTSLQSNIDSFREEQKVQFEYLAAQKAYSAATEFLKKSEPELPKYEKAVATLRALTGEEASADVSAFFDENFLEILDIFKSIHIPKEFQGLRYVDDRLELTTDEGEIRSVSQISTGQRSALALAIFLSLNGKLTNGPNIVMFDDPVSFIDDLNALSFLDHLRLHVLRSGKQIFFATANTRLAGLFEKKFGFLGEDFKRFQLERSETEK
ncbi:DNA repair exonuclease SbcCD ATPase subunit [Dyadobacter soli]|uniref:DNA repair exonuclease SbcCD ATPase subunit n=1 Tax=Dyadobacter soli TaxID=659014 RepID=A0A1G7TCH4_9BACT|nr:ABC-three component system middle component 1 [Dyadobacter soli]SDG33003.1 DNA repair exonuclease SbcCD ATPase subunit [Dyadobacter soli]